jgi:hypothetical protein
MNSLSKRGILAVAIALSQGLLLAPNAVLASDDAVRLAGQVVFSTKAASGGVSADQRAETIQRNLDNALVATKDRTPGSVNIVYVKGMPVITLGGYQVVTVSQADAQQAGTTPAILAQRWADALRGSLQDQASVDSYVNQLSGGYASSAPPAAYNPPPAGGGAMQGSATYSDQFNRQTAPPSYGAPAYAAGAGAGAYGGGAYGGGYPPAGYQRGRVVYAPAGLVMNASLKTSISTQAAQPGDLIEAALTDGVNLGDSSIPPGSVLVGQVSDAKAGGFLGRSGMLGVKFNRLRTPDGVEVPISAHIVGGIGKYANGGGDEFHGETWKNKVGQVALRGAIGAGAGAALGTAVGAIAGRGGRGAGRGAWSGTAIGGGLGVADSLLLRKGRDVTIHSGTNMQVQLDAPVSLSGGSVPPAY